jgi:hypothetical protein
MNTKFTNKIKSLKPSKGFFVASEKQRGKVLKEARELKRFGVIDFEITTREVEGGWKVVAL